MIRILGRYKTCQDPSPDTVTSMLRIAENNSTFPTIKLKKNRIEYKKSCRLKLVFDLKEKYLFNKKLIQKITV
ncbi:MAG: hypothetical protein ACOYEI_06595 [Acetivibrionales bacterium]|jgi:hypothetical protein